MRRKKEPFRPVVFGKCRALEPHDREQTESLVQLADGKLYRKGSYAWSLGVCNWLRQRREIPPQFSLFESNRFRRISLPLYLSKKPSTQFALLDEPEVAHLLCFALATDNAVCGVELAHRLANAGGVSLMRSLELCFRLLRREKVELIAVPESEFPRAVL